MSPSRSWYIRFPESVRGPHHHWTLSRAECASRARFDCSRYKEWSQACGGVTLEISETFKPHWTGWDPKTQRLVVTGREPRLFVVKLDQADGALAMDNSFHDVDGKPGFNFADHEWPHGWKGSGLPHGVVFSR